MPPGLLLALALLATASADRPGEGPPHRAAPGGVPCPPRRPAVPAPRGWRRGAEDPSVPPLAPSPVPAPRHPQEVPAGSAERGRYLRYAVVMKFYTYAAAQRHCQDVLRGQLAAVHSTALNQELMRLARTYTRCKLWIGAVTSYRGGQWESTWEDTSPWNYANWAPTQPCHLFTTCTTLSTYDGLWRSRSCYGLHPFICQY